MTNSGRGTAQNPRDPSPQIAATTASKDIVYFARTNFRHQNKLFGITRKDRRQHMYVIGKTGTGKSALLHNFIAQDIMNGEGLCVVDPHGELVEGILKMIPKERAKDVVYFNPADMDYHIGFNVLELPDPRYKHLVASGLMGIFTKIWSNVWSARMEYFLNNAILALLDTPNTTLLGIPRLLVDKEYRQMIIANLKDPVVKAFWVNEYEEWQDKFRSEAIAPIQNKVGQFLSTALIRNVVGQSRSTLDIFGLMNSQKIFLVNVSKGRIGEDNSALLGAMLITKIQLSAMERVRIAENERKDFYLYVDEFQNFATDSFAGVLSEARKYRLNLIIAHQYVGQLVTDTSTKVRDAVFGNAGTMIIFRVGAADAEWLENELAPEFEIEDVVNIPNYNIYIKLMVNGITVRPFSAATLAPFQTQVEAAGEDMIIKISREKYGRPREVVEKEINRWASGGGLSEDEEGNDTAGEATKVTSSSGKGEMFLSVCNNCGKEAKLPFKPTPGRPVYCSECLEKLQKGLIKPVKIIKKPSVEREAAGISALAGIGIEFSGQKPMPHQDQRRGDGGPSTGSGQAGRRSDGGH
ncbi:MAG: type IV secretion system DNA-binding domain-containing protein, partial [bacterium]|nr:type IV secretion system DNA-binding domain-containing protein [bacterium]